MGFCFPGQDARGADLPPRPECAPAWHAATSRRDCPRISLVLAIGAYAQRWHLGALADRSLTETVAGWREIVDVDRADGACRCRIPSWRNNAWLKKNPWFEAELLPFLRAEIARRLA